MISVVGMYFTTAFVESLPLGNLLAIWATMVNVLLIGHIALGIYYIFNVIKPNQRKSV
jgi:hypothetical protein